MSKEAAALSPLERDRADSRRLRGEQLPPPVNATKELSRVILKALSYKPGDRYPGLKEMREALGKTRDMTRPAGGGGPVDPPRSPRRLIIAAVCLFALLGVGAWQYPNIRNWIDNVRKPAPVSTSAPTSMSVPMSSPAPASKSASKSASKPTSTPVPAYTSAPADPHELDQTDRNALIMEKLETEGIAWLSDETVLSADQSAEPDLARYLYTAFPGDLNNDGKTDTQDAELMERYLDSLAAGA
ncbi:MAG: hypothetical protein IKH68_02495, partial [Erysipelotrichaceae bacterium]|nr:hypothetical protein [Erysipelotrichaceae bacterium]